MPVLTSSADVKTATPDYDGAVKFVMNDAVPAGSIGTLTVRYSTYNVTTANGTPLVVSATATGNNIDPATAQTSVNQTAVAATLRPQHFASYYAYLDRPLAFNLSTSIDQFVNGTEGIGTLHTTITLPAGAVFNSADTAPSSISPDGLTITWDNLPGSYSPATNRYVNYTVTFPSSSFANGQGISVPAQFSGTTLGGLPLTPTSAYATATLRTFVPVLNGYAQLFVDEGRGPNSSSTTATVVSSGKEMSLYWYYNNANSTVPADTSTVSFDVPAGLELTRYAALNDQVDVIQWRTASGATGSFSTADYPDGSSPSLVDMGVPAGDRVVHVDIVGGSIPGPGGGNSGQFYANVTAAPGTTIYAPSTVTYTADGLPNSVANAYQNLYVVAPFPVPSISIYANNQAAARPGDPIDWSITLSGSSQGSIPLQPVIYLPIPAGTVLASTPVTVGNDWSPPPIGFESPTTSVSHNNQLGLDVLKIQWPAGTELPENAYLPVTVHTVMQSAPAGTISAYAYAGDARGPLSEAPYTTIPGSTLDNDSTAVSYAQWVRDDRDIDGDGVPGGVLGRSVGTANTGSGAALHSQLEVRGSLDTDFVQPPVIGATESGHDVSYRLPIENTGNVGLTDVVIYDILPAIGDTGVSAGSANIQRGSQFTPQLDAPITAPTGFEVWYSTSTNPCRPEVYPGLATCDDDWTQTPADITAVRSLKFIQDTGQVLAGGDSTSVTWTMSVSQQVAAGSIAVNSAAFSATRVDNSDTFVSEPAFVSFQVAQSDLAVSIADRTWNAGVAQSTSVNVSNLGPSDSPAHVVVTFPADVTVTLDEGIRAQAALWNCTIDGQVVTCDSVGLVSAGTSGRLPLTVTPDPTTAGTTVPLSAVISGPYPDPDTSNNSAEANIQIPAATPTPTDTTPAPTDTTPPPTSPTDSTPPTTPTSSGPTFITPTNGGGFASTGADVGPWLAMSGLAVLGGLVLLVIRRRTAPQNR